MKMGWRIQEEKKTISHAGSFSELYSYLKENKLFTLKKKKPFRSKQTNVMTQTLQSELHNIYTIASGKPFNHVGEKMIKISF